MILPSRTTMPIVRAALDRGQRIRMSVNGNSMLPFLRSGDLVELEPVDFLRTGDMVLVQTNLTGDAERYRLHRLVKIDENSLYLRGDAQTFTEGPFQREAVLGRIALVWRNGRSCSVGGRFWRRAGLIWACLSPISSLLLKAFLRLLGLGSLFLRWLQRLTVYRTLVKNFCPTYNVQEASLSDLLDLWSGFEDESEKILKVTAWKDPTNTTYFLARSGDKVLGQVCLVRHSEVDFPYKGYWIYSIAVNPFYRGMGIGEEMVCTIIKRAKYEGARELSAWVYENNRVSLAFFQKLGFLNYTLPELEEVFTAERKRNEPRKISLRKKIDD